MVRGALKQLQSALCMVYCNSRPVNPKIHFSERLFVLDLPVPPALTLLVLVLIPFVLACRSWLGCSRLGWLPGLRSWLCRV